MGLQRRIVVALFVGYFGGLIALQAEPADVVINELLYNAAPSNDGGEFLELYNRGDTAVDLSGWTLSDAVDFTFPDGTQLMPGEFLVVARNAEEVRDFYEVPNVVGEYEGRLNNAGESILLHDASDPKVEIDSVSYDDAEPWPLEADGGGPSLELLDPAADNSDPANWALGQSYSPGAPNDPVLANTGDIAISEIQYKPKREEYRREFDRVTQSNYWEDGDDVFGEYVELYNRSMEVVDLTGWYFSDGFTYEFEEGASIEPGAYVIVSSDPGVMIARYGLTNIIGQFSGTLSNNGERITLRNATGAVVDSVRYNDKHPWPIAPDEHGVSLECIDLLADNGSAGNWRASRAEFPPPFAASPLEEGWQFLTVTGSAPSDNLYIYLLDGAGEWLIDDIRLQAPGNEENIIENGSFETDDSPWQKTGSHAESSRTTEDAHDGMACERIVATRRGGGPANSVYLKDIPGVVTGEQYTLSCWVKFISGGKRLGVRFTSSGLGVSAEAPQSVSVDWSDTENPNGLWSYRDAEGAVITAQSANWHAEDLGAEQPAWSAADDGPGWCRSVGNAADLDFPAGAVAVLGPGEVWWTADDDGLVRVGGGAWLLRHSGGPQSWYILKNGNLVTEGELIPGETEFTSASPKSFESGTRGAQVLTIEVEEDDIIRVGVSASDANDFVGFNINVRFGVSEPDPPVGGVLGNGTPGQVNSVIEDAVPPFVRQLEHFPELPTPTDPVQITVRVTPNADQTIAAVRLETSILIGRNEEIHDMFDDGEHGDLEAGDGVYGLTLEPHASHVLVHYRVIAEDTAGQQTSFPYDDDPSPTRAYYSYDGDVQTKVTFLDLFISDATLGRLRSNPRSPEYLDASVAINGVAYPHIGIRKRGRQSRLNAKHQWKFRFNRGEFYNKNRHLDCFLNVPDQIKWAFDVYEMGGTENLKAELLRVHVNGRFFGLYCAAEAPNAAWLAKRGHDGDGEVYKARVVETPGEAKNSDLYHNQIVTDEDYHGSYNKKVRPLERPVHIRELVNALNDLNDDELLPWMDANVDLHNWYRRWALAILMRMPDFCGHNYYMFLPSNGDGTYGKWQKMDYDFDHGFGSAKRATYGDGVGGIPGWQRNKLYQRTSRNRTLLRIYYLTLREIIETVFIDEVLNMKIDELFTNAAPERSLDRSKWGTSLPSSSGIKAAMRAQSRAMVTFLNRQSLPTNEDIPTADPPGGMFDGPTLVTLTTTEGRATFYTIDGTDPRLSPTRQAYTEPFTLETSGLLKVAAIAEDLNFKGGDWTGAGDYQFEIEIAPEPEGVGPFTRGDCDGNGVFGGSPTEAIVLLNFSFRGGPPPSCLAACDAEANGSVGITDALRILRAAFLGDGQPDAPFPDCTTSTLETDVALGCEIPTACVD